ncbi:MAG: hypothetical protein KKF56_03305 [Nanoarchaeota archaeon]|nr:hypothetical protein [Nanoarchaeota archaeon]
MIKKLLLGLTLATTLLYQGCMVLCVPRNQSRSEYQFKGKIDETHVEFRTRHPISRCYSTNMLRVVEGKRSTSYIDKDNDLKVDKVVESSSRTNSSGEPKDVHQSQFDYWLWRIAKEKSGK